jgi:hypothetical protein
MHPYESLGTLDGERVRCKQEITTPTNVHTHKRGGGWEKKQRLLTSLVVRPVVVPNTRIG